MIYRLYADRRVSRCANIRAPFNVSRVVDALMSVWFCLYGRLAMVTEEVGRVINFHVGGGRT